MSRPPRDIAREVAYAVAARTNDEGLAPEFSQEKGRQTVAERNWSLTVTVKKGGLWNAADEALNMTQGQGEETPVWLKSCRTTPLV